MISFKYFLRCATRFVNPQITLYIKTVNLQSSHKHSATFYTQFADQFFGDPQNIMTTEFTITKAVFTDKSYRQIDAGSDSLIRKTLDLRHRLWIRMFPSHLQLLRFSYTQGHRFYTPFVPPILAHPQRTMITMDPEAA